MQPPSDAPPPTDDLQFDRAEYSAIPAAPLIAMCGVCHNTLRDRYYDINGQVACAACRDKAVAELQRGSRFGRFAKALGLGFLAALLGAGVYFGIAAITGYEIGLVAIVLGLLVGMAVRIGSNGRGGPFYQLLSVLLTYFAIGVAYSSLMILEMSKNPESLLRSLDAAAASQPVADDDATSSRTGPSGPTSTTQPEVGQDSGDDLAAAAASGAALHKWDNAGPGEKALTIALASVYAAVILFSLPIVSATHQPIGFLIIGIALWQAWATNKRARLKISGPFVVSSAAPPTAPPQGPPHA